MRKHLTVLIPVFVLGCILISKSGWITGLAGSGWNLYLAEKMSQHAEDSFLPVFAYAGTGKPTTVTGQLGERLLRAIPLYGYCLEEEGSGVYLADMQNGDVEDEAVQGENEEEEYRASLQEEGWGEDFARVQEENEDRQEELEQIRKQEEADERNLDQMLLMENIHAGIDSFSPHTKINGYDWESLKDYKTLVSTFYAIDSTTMIGSDQLNAEALLSRDMAISKQDPAPQILIYHTHSREAFADSAEGDSTQTILGVGELLTQILTQQYGYSVLHHLEQYDEVRDQAYAKSLPAMEQLLKDNPSIQVIIDLHRDAGAEGRHLAMDIDGRPTAKFMFFNGLSRTRKTGDIDYLYNPNLADNLSFSFQMQAAAGEYYPGLTRKIYLKGYRYNMHLLPRTLLIELGDSNNTVEEAMNACYPLAHLLDIVLSGQNKQ